MKKIMNSKLPAKQKNGIFYKILLKIKQIFRRKKYEEKKELIGEIKVAIQEGQELDEQINSKEQSQK